MIECGPHKCKPYSASTVRQAHAIISGALTAATHWRWIAYNPASSVRLPAKRRPQPKPPSAEDTARIIEAANEASTEWGTYVWLCAVTGARRGEVVALQWEDIDLAGGVVVLDENYVRGPDGMILKDTKTHQGRRVSLDPETVTLLRQHKDAATKRLQLLGSELTGKTLAILGTTGPQQASRPEFADAAIQPFSREARNQDATERASPLLRNRVAHCRHRPPHYGRPSRARRRYDNPAALCSVGRRSRQGRRHDNRQPNAEAGHARRARLPDTTPDVGLS